MRHFGKNNLASLLIAVVFQDGQAIKGTWRKPSRNERMKFFDELGKEIEFNAGVTWVEIVPVGYKVGY